MGNVRLYGSTSGYTELAPPAVAPDGVLSLPSGTGTIATQDYAASAGGLVHINTTTFSAVSSVSLNDVFSATFNNYRIVAKFVTSSYALPVFFRYRVGGVDNTSTATYLTRGGDQGAFISAAVDASEFRVCSGYPGGNYFTMDSLDPFASQYTTGGFNSSATLIGVADTARFGSFTHASNTSFDGFTLYTTSGTTTGTVRVYGYKNGA